MADKNIFEFGIFETYTDNIKYHRITWLIRKEITFFQLLDEMMKVCCVRQVSELSDKMFEKKKADEQNTSFLSLPTFEIFKTFNLLILFSFSVL